MKRFHLQHIQIDPILEAFEDVFPELGITHNAFTSQSHNEVCRRFKPFLFRMIDGMEYDNFVIEGFRMPLEDIIETYAKTHQIFVFGYPQSTPAQKVAQCRKHDTVNWTNDLDDKALEGIMAFLIEQSGRLKAVCDSRGIPFYDTGTEYWTVIQKALATVV